MKPNPIATRALAGMLPAMALFATPAFAQDAAQPAAVPPPTVVVPTPPAAEPAPPVAAAPEAPAATGPSAEDRAKFEASATAATGTASSAAAEAAPAAETRRAPTRPAARAAAAPARVTRAPAAPVQAAPAAPTVTEAAPAPAAPAAPTATTPVPDAPMTTPIPEESVAAAPATADTATTETTTESGGVPVWGWVLGAIAILGAIAAIVGLRRRRNENVWEEEAVYEEPAYVGHTYADREIVAPVEAAPIAAAPVVDTVVEDHAEVVTPAADEVAAITAASAPVTGRPWIELSLRPVRAGATDESAIVDLELTLANAGEVEARNVRVSTFMLGDASDAPSDMDRLLATNHGGTEVSAGQIGAGEGSRVDATLAVPRGELDGPTFQPIVVADVRYALPDGSEGRTAAAFAVGVDDGTEEPTPLRLGGDMRDDVAATLHGVLERA